MKEDMISSLIILLAGIVVMILIFLAIRAIILWYWKIDTIVLNQEKQIALLRELVNQKKPKERPVGTED